jgi:hypothetical protein
MKPHSRPCSTHNGTLRLPQALLLLLRTAIAGPTSDRVTQTETDRALRDGQNIKKSAHRLIQLLNPFVVSGGWPTLNSVGMVELALCGIGSVLWLWSKRNGNGSAVDAQHAIDAAAGELLSGNWRSRGVDIQPG